MNWRSNPREISTMCKWKENASKPCFCTLRDKSMQGPQPVICGCDHYGLLFLICSSNNIFDRISQYQNRWSTPLAKGLGSFALLNLQPTWRKPWWKLFSHLWRRFRSQLWQRRSALSAIISSVFLRYTSKSRFYALRASRILLHS